MSFSYLLIYWLINCYNCTISSINSFNNFESLIVIVEVYFTTGFYFLKLLRPLNVDQGILLYFIAHLKATCTDKMANIGWLSQLIMPFPQGVLGTDWWPAINGIIPCFPLFFYSLKRTLSVPFVCVCKRLPSQGFSFITVTGREPQKRREGPVPLWVSLPSAVWLEPPPPLSQQWNVAYLHFYWSLPVYELLTVLQAKPYFSNDRSSISVFLTKRNTCIASILLYYAVFDVKLRRLNGITNG